MTTRAGLVVTLALGLLAAPLPADAQRPVKMPRIGYLGETPGSFVNSFREALRDLGYVEGQTIATEYRWGEGRHDRLSLLAAELVQLKVDVIVTPGTQTSRAAQQATATIPIVLAHVGNPVGAGLVASLARPGGNITGVSVLGSELAGKQLELLKEAVPRISRIAVLWNPTGAALLALRELEVAAQALGVTLEPTAVRAPKDFEMAFATLGGKRADALLVLQDHVLFSHRTRIVDFAAKNRLPAMYMYREWTDAGGLLAYGASLREVYSRVAALVDKVLNGANPAALPVEQVTRLELVVNLKTAKALGLTIPQSILLRADEVIE